MESISPFDPLTPEKTIVQSCFSCHRDMSKQVFCFQLNSTVSVLLSAPAARLVQHRGHFNETAFETPRSNPFDFDMNHEKRNSLTFHCTGCSIRILIMVYYNSHIIVWSPILYPKQPHFFHCFKSCLLLNQCLFPWLFTCFHQGKTIMLPQSCSCAANCQNSWSSNIKA